MTTEGIEAVFLTTRSWGRAARFFRAPGFEVEFETDQARPGPAPASRSSRRSRTPATGPRR